MVLTPFAGRSSNGKTADSGSAYRGSSPCLPAKQVDILTRELRYLESFDKKSFDPNLNMRTLAFSSLLLLFAIAAFGQDTSDVFDKAPPAIDEALRARVGKFYGAFIAGKFKEAYLLVADDSQDKFFELSKDEYKSFDIIKINNSDNFTKAAVVTAIKSDWRWHGVVTLTTFPLTSNWVVIDGQWYWHYARPTIVANPFSPTGFVPVPPAASSTDNAEQVPKDIKGAARAILAKVAVDKSSVRLRSYEASQDVVHVRNDMPGEISLKLVKPDVQGLTVTLGKSALMAHEETTVAFDWRLDDPAIQCLECAKKMSGRRSVQLYVSPTGQMFPIVITFENTPQKEQPAPPQAAAPQVPAPLGPAHQLPPAQVPPQN
jgi:hypothetical protein